MTDLKRHSEGIWRSIYVFAPIRNHDPIISWFEEVMKKLGVEEYSWCHYGEIRNPILGVSEGEHITFRVSFPDRKTYNAFREQHLEKADWTWKWEDHGYDEALWVKRAYVIGTKLFKLVREVVDHPDVHMNRNFLQLLFHGFFNDAHFNSKEETEFYLFLFQSFLANRYGIKAVGLYDKSKARGER